MSYSCTQQKTNPAGDSMKYNIEQGSELINSVGGLSLVGLLLKRSGLKQRLKSLSGDSKKALTRTADVFGSIVGLLCQGRTDYEDIEVFRDDELFRDGLDLARVYSSASLRQRFDEAAGNYDDEIADASINLLRAVDFGTVKTSTSKYIPYDIDVSPFDNSKSHKEEVSRTYKGHDGFAPMFGYIGTEGYMLNCELRPGRQHCQDGTLKFLSAGLDRLEELGILDRTLVRMDAGNDSSDNIKLLLDRKVDFLIKRNLRKESKEQWLATAKALGSVDEPRPGKKIWRGSVAHVHPAKLPEGTSVIVVYEVTERTETPDGQVLLYPEITVDTYWTTLGDSAKEIIELYHSHATSEQFHSEVKTDLDVERLPSSKFKTNATFLLLAMLTYNILRTMGQDTVKFAVIAPKKITVARRRLASVIKDLIFVGCKIVSHAGSKTLKFGRHCPWYNVFATLHANYSHP